jgi:sugar lactone lactonase YvrE
MKRLLHLLLILPLFAAAQTTPLMTTIAGNHAAGYTGNGGTATSASMYKPHGVAVDGAGNVYIAEPGNQVVRRVSPSGIITVIAGNHTTGYSGDGGYATAAQLYLPADVCLDRYGNIYVSEIGNHCVRKITTTGFITTFAGNGTVGNGGDGGLADTATLNGPFGIAFDTSGNLFIADAYSNCIRKVAVSGIIYTVAGNSGATGYTGDGGPATGATFNSPHDIAFDSSRNMYIADFGNNVIRKINTFGTISTMAGTGAAGYLGDTEPATDATFRYPYALCMDTANNIYISDSGNACIRKINTAGIIQTVAGYGVPGYSGDGAPATMAQLNSPAGLTTDIYGNIYIADFGNDVIRKVVVFNPTLGIKTLANDGIAICPNPAKNVLNVSAANGINVVNITNVSGETVFSHQYNANKIQITVEGLPAGLYYIRVNDSVVRGFLKE